MGGKTKTKTTKKRSHSGLWLTLSAVLFLWVIASFILYLFPLRLDVDAQSYVGLTTSEAKEKAYKEYVALTYTQSPEPKEGDRFDSSLTFGVCAARGYGSYRGVLACGISRAETAKERLTLIEVKIANDKIIEARHW